MIVYYMAYKWWRYHQDRAKIKIIKKEKQKTNVKKKNRWKMAYASYISIYDSEMLCYPGFCNCFAHTRVFSIFLCCLRWVIALSHLYLCLCKWILLRRRSFCSDSSVNMYVYVVCWYILNLANFAILRLQKILDFCAHFNYFIGIRRRF